MVDSKDLFEVLVREHADMLTAYLRSVLGDSPDVDDVFQETLVVAWRRLDDFDRARPFGPWLRGIARNLAAAHCRMAARRRCTPVVLDQIEARLDQVAALHGDTWQEKLAHLSDCVERLPEQHHAPLTLRYFQQQTIQQVSVALDLSAAAVKKRLQRARLLVMECINRKLLPAEKQR